MTRLPLDKSWIKCITLLEIQDGGTKVQDFLNNFPQDELSEDVKACRDVLNSWNYCEHLPVRNFRSLAVGVHKILQWKNLNTSLILMGSELNKRKLIDENSSQSFSADILNIHDTHHYDGAIKIINDLKYHNMIAVDARTCWNGLGENHFPIYREDRTLTKQFNYFIRKLQGEDITLEINSAEDIPLAYMMNEIELDEAEKRFPSLRNHETDRIEELEHQKRRLYKKPSIICTDHRIVMACAMAERLLYEDNGEDTTIGYDWAVNKSFPKFWEYLDEMVEIYGQNILL